MKYIRITLWALLVGAVIGLCYWGYSAATSYDAGRKAEVASAKEEGLAEIARIKAQLEQQLADAQATAKAAKDKAEQDANRIRIAEATADLAQRAGQPPMRFEVSGLVRNDESHDPAKFAASLVGARYGVRVIGPEELGPKTAGQYPKYHAIVPIIWPLGATGWRYFMPNEGVNMDEKLLPHVTGLAKILAKTGNGKEVVNGYRTVIVEVPVHPEDETPAGVSPVKPGNKRFRTVVGFIWNGPKPTEGEIPEIKPNVPVGS
jgi:hypothetical protein